MGWDTKTIDLVLIKIDDDERLIWQKDDAYRLDGIDDYDAVVKDKITIMSDAADSRCD